MHLKDEVFILMLKQILNKRSATLNYSKLLIKNLRRHQKENSQKEGDPLRNLGTSIWC